MASRTAAHRADAAAAAAAATTTAASDVDYDEAYLGLVGNPLIDMF